MVSGATMIPFRRSHRSIAKLGQARYPMGCSSTIAPTHTESRRAKARTSSANKPLEVLPSRQSKGVRCPRNSLLTSPDELDPEVCLRMRNAGAPAMYSKCD
jgi:hypothetical protein